MPRETCDIKSIDKEGRRVRVDRCLCVAAVLISTIM